MINVNKKNKVKNKTFEFLTIFSMTFGIVVGSGIYLKNSGDNGVLARANDNPWVAMAVWVFVGIFACMMMFTFLEASSAAKKDDYNSMGVLGAQFLGRKWGSLFSIFFIVIYTPLLTIIGALFTINSLFSAIDAFMLASGKGLSEAIGGNDVRIVVELILGAVTLVTFQAINSIYKDSGKWIQIIFSILKFVPLIIVIGGGITLYATGNVENNTFTNQGGFKFNSIFACLIPILFAFDGFLDSINIQHDIEHKKVVSPAMLTGVISVAVFYLIVTVSIFLVSPNGNVLTMFDKASPGFSLAFNLIITLTLLTTINAYTTLYPKIVQASYDEKYLYKRSFDEKIKWKNATWISVIITDVVIVTFVTTSLLIDSTDYFLVADYSADTGILYAFTVYALIMYGVIRNRKTKKLKSKKWKTPMF
ncbi:amino acid permease [Spiroplasma clarkii]|uniref:amino acid permease n=1 Tax=Spiroplasma clarkii TaxID=2139 RepID=UPI0011BA96FC|nr:amino acid permease [Spiroplasma clarkii]